MSRLQQNIRFMLEALPGRKLQCSAVGGLADEDARLTLSVTDGASVVEIALTGEQAFSIAKGMMNCLARGGMDLSHVPTEAGAFEPRGRADA